MVASAWGSAFAIAMLLTTGSAALAQTRAWTIAPSIGLRGTYTDNVSLAATPERGEFVTDVNPGLQVTGRGRRFSANLLYNADVLFYARHHEQDRIANTLNASGKLEAIERFFFIDADARVGQDYISPFAPRPSDITTITNNRTETRTLSLSPYVRGQFLGGYTYELRNRNTWTSTDTSVLAKVHTRQWDGTVASPIRYFGWAVDGNDTDIVYDEPVARPERKSRLARGRILFQPDSSVRLSASVGREENNFILGQELQSYRTYGYGALWRPGPRTTAQFDWERRFFGPSRIASLQHRMRLSVVDLSYSKTAATYQQQLLRVPFGNTAELLDLIFRARIPDPVERQQVVQQFMRTTGTPPFLTGSLAFYTEKIFVDERLQGSFAIVGARNSIAFTAFRGRSTALTETPPGVPADAFLLASRIDQHGFGTNASHRLTPFTSVSASANRIFSTANSGIDSVNDSLSVNVSHTVSPRTTTLGGITYTRFDPSNTSPTYARSVFAGLLHRF